MAGNNYYSSIRNQAKISTKTMGSSTITAIKSAFPGSPIHSGELTFEERMETFQKLALDGDVNEAGAEEGLNGPGNGYSAGINRDYNQNNAPDIPALAEDVLKLEELNLVSPYFPNLTSPGPNFDATQAPLYAGEIKNRNDINNFGTGFRGTYNPLQSSEKIANVKIETLANLVGRSAV